MSYLVLQELNVCYSFLRTRLLISVVFITWVVMSRQTDVRWSLVHFNLLSFPGKGFTTSTSTKLHIITNHYPWLCHCSGIENSQKADKGSDVPRGNQITIFIETGLECSIHATNVLPFETMKRSLLYYFLICQTKKYSLTGYCGFNTMLNNIENIFKTLSTMVSELI